MYIYNVGFGSYEESDFKQLAFDQELTPDQLHKYVSQAIVKVLSDIIDGKHGKFYISSMGISYEDIHDYVIEELINVGFKELKFTAEWDCFGWAPLTNKKSWKRDRTGTLDCLYNEIPEHIKVALEKITLEQNLIFVDKLHGFNADKNSCRDHSKLDLVISPTGDLENTS